jgi:hypothetical protein
VSLARWCWRTYSYFLMRLPFDALASCQVPVRMGLRPLTLSVIVRDCRINCFSIRGLWTPAEVVIWEISRCADCESAQRLSFFVLYHNIMSSEDVDLVPLALTGIDSRVAVTVRV